MPSEVGFEQALLLIMIVTALGGMFIGVNSYGLVTGKHGLFFSKYEGRLQKHTEQFELFMARLGMLVFASFTLYLDYENGLLILSQASQGIESDFVQDAYYQMAVFAVGIIMVFPVDRKQRSQSPSAMKTKESGVETM